MPGKKPDLWDSSKTYEQYMGRWSRQVAPLFLEWLGAPGGQIWADIGCGTGELTAQIMKNCAPARCVGFDPSEAFVATARGQSVEAEFHVGVADHIDLPKDSVDIAVSGLVLNFIPDQTKPVSEMVRIVRPAGKVALYVWDYAGHMQIMRYFFDTARKFDSRATEYDDGINAPICRPVPLRKAFEYAGLANVETCAIDIPTPFESFDDYWAPFLGGTGSAPKYCASLDEATRIEIRDAIRTKLPTGPDGEILLAARAWAVKGNVTG
ncbi:MAG: class I SAM-dependent methyltransferase [Alphaproteobacteria bacterium]